MTNATRSLGSIPGCAVWLWLLAVAPVSGQSLVFDEPCADLGRVSSAGAIDHVFRFHVDGAPARIEEIRPSCGCLRPKLDKMTYQPGERGAIVLAVHAASQRPGPKRFQLTLRVCDPDPRTVTLSLVVALFSDLVIEPSNLLLYVAGRDAVEQSIRIIDRRATPIPVTHVATSTPRIAARCAPVTELVGTAARVVTVNLRVAGDFPVGQFEETVEVRTTDPTYPVLLIPVTVVRRGRLTVLPERLAVPAEQLRDRPVLRQVILRDQDGMPIRIADVSTSVAGIRAAWPTSAERYPRVRLTLDPTLLKPPADAELRFHIVEPIATTLTTTLTIE